MTRNDFELIALIIRAIPTEERNLSKEDIATLFAAGLGAANPRFDRERFIKATRTN